MGLVSGNKLNRLWQKHIVPIKNAVTGKLDSSKIVASTNITQPGFAMDGKTCSDALNSLNSKIIDVEIGSNKYGNYKKYSNGQLEMWGTVSITDSLTQNNSIPYYTLECLIDLPISSVVPCVATIDVAHNGVIWASLTSGTNFKNQIPFRLYGTRYVNINVMVHWHAWGTWK